MHKCCTAREKGNNNLGTLVYMLQRRCRHKKEVEKITVFNRDGEKGKNRKKTVIWRGQTDFLAGKKREKYL